MIHLKIDRLLGIMIYLLNHDTVSASALAGRFEVSVRTIQRDIETLGMAGIPVASTQGVNGGYSILKSFKLSKQLLSEQDYVLILTALKGLCSAYEHRGIEATFEKLLSLSPDGVDAEQNIHLDFSVLREGFHVRDYLSGIEDAIRKKHVIQFEYTNAEYVKSQRTVEPVVLTYKWYAWYLLGFCCEKQDYRMFRLTRMRNLGLTSAAFSNVHNNIEELLAQKNDHQPYFNIKLACSTELRIPIEECFPNSCITEIGDRELLIEFSVPANERGWFGTLLSFGSKVTVLEPTELKHKLVEHAKEILEAYLSHR
ncbi:HTH domain protein [compost metagenome]